MSLSDYENLSEFAQAVHSELPDEWDTKLDSLGLEKTDDTIAGYQRDDLYRWMIVMPTNSDWPPEELRLYMPENIDEIADRPGVPVHTVKNPSLEEILEKVRQLSLDYQGTFTYDE